MNNVSQLRSDHAVRFVWCLTDERFRESIETQTGSSWQNFDWQKVEWNRAIIYAQQSRGLLYKFCKEALKTGRDHLNERVLRRLNMIAERGDQDLRRLRRTLVTIKTLWEGQTDYFVIKTRDDRPTGDADILFPEQEDYELAISLALRKGYEFIREEPLKGWIGIKDGVKIELHSNISWFGMEVFDSDFVVRNPGKIRLMNIAFPTIDKQAELALELAHWVVDIQGLGPVGFANLVSAIEKNKSWEDILHQATRYDWVELLIYHLSVLNDFCKYVYDSSLRVPANLLRHEDAGPKLNFPFWIPARRKIPFLARKILRDNEGTAQKLRMLQLALRRYAWARIWQ